MDYLLNIKSKWNHCILEYLIKKNDTSQDMSRSAVFEREVKAAEGVNNWKEVQASLSELKKEPDAPIFTNLQARYGDKTADILKTVRADILSQLKDTGLKILQNQYMVLLLQANYLLKLKQEKKMIKADDMVNETEVSMPEMAKILCEMMLTDKECDELLEIRRVLVNWRNRE